MAWPDAVGFVPNSLKELLGIPKNPKLLQFVVLFTVVSSFVLLIRPLPPWIRLEVSHTVIRLYARRPIDYTSPLR